MKENNNSSYNNSPVREVDISKKLDTNKKSFIESSSVSKNVSKE